MNVKTVKRFGSYLIDLMCVGLILMIINFFTPESSEIDNLNKQLSLLNENYLNGEVSTTTYLNDYASIVYKLDHVNVNKTGINILVIIIYFIIIPTINGGKTLGLYINGYKIKGEEKDASLFQLFVRNLIANGLLYTLVSFILIYILKAHSYFIVISILGIVQILLVIISCFMIICKEDKKGLQDIISKTIITD